MLFVFPSPHAIPSVPVIALAVVAGFVLTKAVAYALPLVLKHNQATLEEWDVPVDIKIANPLVFALGFVLAIIASFAYAKTLPWQILSSVLLCSLWVLLLIDWYSQFIFDDTLYPLAILGCLAIYLQPWPWYYSLLAAAGAFVVMLLLAILGRGAMGGGDVKLMAVMGLWLGPLGIIRSMMLGFIVGGVAAVCFLIFSKKTRKDYFAFGPYLIVGCIYTWLNLVGLF